MSGTQPTTLEIIHQRHSVRAFEERAVSKEDVETILKAAAQAPSSTNMQPWKVHVISGESKRRMDEAFLKAFDEGAFEEVDLETYLEEWVEPFKGRRLATGMALYGSLGIDRKDKTRRKEQARKNFNAFGAPMVLLFTMPKLLKEGSLFDMGMFVQTAILAAESLGLASCPQASLVAFPSLLRNLFQISEEERFITGLALGYEDHGHPVNHYRTEREVLENFASFHD